jgi:hypothetical protein
LEQISKEDLELASDVIFKGFAEKEFSLDKMGIKIKVTTSRAEDFDIVNELVFEFTKEHDKGGTFIDIPRDKVTRQEKFYTLALCFVGLDGQDLSQTADVKLELIRRAINRMLDAHYDGNLEEYQKLKNLIYTAVKKRASLLRKLSPYLIDAIQECKANLDQKMYQIMRVKDLIPKL